MSESLGCKLEVSIYRITTQPYKRSCCFYTETCFARATYIFMQMFNNYLKAGVHPKKEGRFLLGVRARLLKYNKAGVHPKKEGRFLVGVRARLLKNNYISLEQK